MAAKATRQLLVRAMYGSPMTYRPLDSFSGATSLDLAKACPERCVEADDYNPQQMGRTSPVVGIMLNLSERLKGVWNRASMPRTLGRVPRGAPH